MKTLSILLLLITSLLSANSFAACDHSAKTLCQPDWFWLALRPLSRDEAAQRAMQEYGGRVISIRPSKNQNPPEFTIRLLDKGVVREVLISDQPGNSANTP